MYLQIEELWSPDLHPPDGVPADRSHFDVFVQVALSERGKGGAEVFGFRACSPSALSKIESGTFLSTLLILDKFDWDSINDRLRKLLMHCASCVSWECVIKKLSGSVRHDGE
jgi:hypothetical protein